MEYDAKMTAQKWIFPLKISSVNAIKSAVDLVPFTEIVNGKQLHIFVLWMEQR